MPSRTCDSSSPCTVQIITHGCIIRAWKLGHVQASGSFISVTCRRPRQAQVASATVTRAIEVDARLHAKYCTDTFQTETHPPHETSSHFYITDTSHMKQALLWYSPKGPSTVTNPAYPKCANIASMQLRNCGDQTKTTSKRLAQPNVTHMFGWLLNSTCQWTKPTGIDSHTSSSTDNLKYNSTVQASSRRLTS